jgi:uncharacterized membrane protein
LEILAVLAGPACVLWLCRNVRLAGVLGPVLLAYALGIGLGNALALDPKLALSLGEGVVPLGIPLLLLGTDLRAWARLARPTLVSFVLACVSAVAAAGITGWLFRHQSDEWWMMAGMLVGVYTGGTANMSAVGLSLGVRQETFVLLNAADVLAGAAYLLFLMSVAQRALWTFLPKFEAPAGGTHGEEPALGEAPIRWPHVLQSLGFAAASAGLTAGLVWLALGRLEVAPVMLGLTAAGLGGSLVKRLRTLPGSAETGEYLMLCFCVAIGMLADVKTFQAGSTTALGMVFGCMFGAIALHLVLAALFRIDTDTVLITSTATIFGPPFVGPVAKSLANRHLLASGMTAGLMGYALGTWLGLATSWGLKALSGAGP